MNFIFFKRPKKSSIMKLAKSSIFICSLLFLFGACKKDDVEPTPTTNNFVVPIITPSGNEQYLNLSSDYVFDQEMLHTFELQLPADALAAIDADPSAEEYVEGMLIFAGDTISPVGVRYKGSVGAFVNCLSNSNGLQSSGYKVCTKLSMKVKINWEEREEKFYGLKKLQFHSQNLDPSKMHERLGYWLFREMGVPAPRSVHARLLINGEYVGLFALTEQIDKRFIKQNFNDDEGNLYKEVWPLNQFGTPYADHVYLNALKTNESNNPSIDFIKNFGLNISNAATSAVPNIIEQTMDIDKIMSYIVVDRMIRHDDGPFHWYCSGGSCNNHNYYWYEEPTDQKLHLIPWDLDNAFENIIADANPVTPIADAWGDTSSNCQPFSYGSLGFIQKSASCDKLTAGWASFTDKFQQKKAQFKNDAFSETQVNQLLNKWSNQIRNATIEASNDHNDAISLTEWENALNQLRNQLEFARNH